jgi:hypothetical protein
MNHAEEVLPSAPDTLTPSPEGNFGVYGGPIDHPVLASHLEAVERSLTAALRLYWPTKPDLPRPEAVAAGRRADCSRA